MNITQMTILNFSPTEEKWWKLKAAFDLSNYEISNGGGGSLSSVFGQWLKSGVRFTKPSILIWCICIGPISQQLQFKFLIPPPYSSYPLY